MTCPQSVFDAGTARRGPDDRSLLGS